MTFYDVAVDLLRELYGKVIPNIDLSTLNSSIRVEFQRNRSNAHGNSPNNIQIEALPSNLHTKLILYTLIVKF